MPRKDPEKLKRYRKEYYEKNKKNMYEKVKIRRALNRNLYLEKSRITSKAHYEKNKDAIMEKTRLRLWKKKYGITKDDFDEMMVAQWGACPICDKILGKYIAIDHDHKTGVVRGILHRKCNAVLGFFDDNPIVLLRALGYLIKGDANGYK